MSRRHPPRLAIWILRKTGISAENEPLAGDLLEEFDLGRTSPWFWRQTLVAIWCRFWTGLRIVGPDLVPWCIGWLVEIAVLIGLRLFHVPFGLHSLLPAGAVFGGIGLVMYLDYRVRYYFWFHDSSLSEEESDLYFERRIWPRWAVLKSFWICLRSEVLVGLIGIVPALRPSFSFVVVTNVLGVIGLVVFGAISATGSAAAPGSENS